MSAELDDYLELARAGPSLSDEQHFYNKLIFDAVNDSITECIVDVSVALHLHTVVSLLQLNVLLNFVTKACFAVICCCKGTTCAKAIVAGQADLVDTEPICVMHVGSCLGVVAVHTMLCHRNSHLHFDFQSSYFTHMLLVLVILALLKTYQNKNLYRHTSQRKDLLRKGVLQQGDDLCMQAWQQQPPAFLQQQRPLRRWPTTPGAVAQAVQQKVVSMCQLSQHGQGDMQDINNLMTAALLNVSLLNARLPKVRCILTQRIQVLLLTVNRAALC